MRGSLVSLLLIVALATGLSACSSSDGDTGKAPSPAQAKAKLKSDLAKLKGAPAPLASLHAQAGQLLDGGADAFQARMKKLRGRPVVVNKWGSWCPPCRAEFPYFQDQAVKHGKQIAFVGVDGQDPGDGARKFLTQYPVPFPSYKDPDLKIAAKIKAVGAFPSTVFYDSKGEIVHLEQGSYQSERELEADIRRYAA